MKRVYFMMLIALFLVMLISHASAQIIFFADFEAGSSDAVPDASVNDPANYVSENEGTIWAESTDFPDGGTALHQTAEGCGISGNTPLPSVDDFSDGIIQAVFSWQDDDGVGFQFRRVGDDSGYLVAFGYNETAQIIIGSLADGCCPSGQCLDQCSCENGGNELVGVDHGLGAGLSQDNSVAYFGRIQVTGRLIEVWYMPLADVPNLFVDSEELGDPVATYNGADDLGPGIVGVWHESWRNGRIGSILVTGSNGFTTTTGDPDAKLSTAWDDIKDSYGLPSLSLEYKLYWTDLVMNKIQRANPDGTDVQNLITTGLSSPDGIALDVAGGKMYWTDWQMNRIQRANLDGTDVQNLITTGLSGPDGIALDVAGGKMYWTDVATRKIQRANLDGTNVQDLITTGLSNPEGIALDVADEKIYWTDKGVAKIRLANLDGTNVQDLITTGLSQPIHIALDIVGGKMYWVDDGTDKIQRANLDGTDVQDLVITGLSSPYGIVLDVAGGKMYWTDRDTGKIQRANLDGTDVQDLITTGLSSPRGIALSISPRALQQIQQADVNSNGVVDIQDLVLVAANFGETRENPADVNGDGIVNIADLALVAEVLEKKAAGAPALRASALESLSAADVQHWLRIARQANLTEPAFQRGIRFLERLPRVAALTPKETALLPNYPNPFNPETWIPYQLTNPAEVSISIHSTDGKLIRTLALGNQPAGIYHSRSRASYWDGRNQLGESVASGIYFYTLTAGDFTATKKMLIRK